MRKKILLINLAKGKIGEENSQFLGLILVPKILVAAMSRQDMAKDKREDFFLYVDEFQILPLRILPRFCPKPENIN